ncbi:MAG: hypothetical protein GF363_01200 [Chitinivibrionales bacterium]|nr:hypothetical protein [Chitinivibrionales bacterium]
MADLDTILAEARTLSPAQRTELVHKLLEQSNQEAKEDETQTGRRGLETWTQSARAEDWERYYPDSLHRQ